MTATTDYSRLTITVTYCPDNLDVDNQVSEQDSGNYALACVQEIRDSYPGATVTVNAGLSCSHAVESTDGTEDTSEVAYSVRRITDRVYESGKFWS